MKLIAMLRTFLVFFVGGVLLATAAISIVMGGGVIWMDCFHDNPGHVCGDAILLAIVTPFYSLVLATFIGFTPLVAGAVLAVAGRAFFRCVPLWYAMALLPVCLLVYLVQGALWFPHDDMRPLSERLLMFSGFQTATLLICWWWDRRGDLPLRVIAGA
jgi:hypothetical protein